MNSKKLIPPISSHLQLSSPLPVDLRKCISNGNTLSDRVLECRPFTKNHLILYRLLKHTLLSPLSDKRLLTKLKADALDKKGVEVTRVSLGMADTPIDLDDVNPDTISVLIFSVFNNQIAPILCNALGFPIPELDAKDHSKIAPMGHSVFKAVDEDTQFWVGERITRSATEPASNVDLSKVQMPQEAAAHIVATIESLALNSAELLRSLDVVETIVGAARKQSGKDYNTNGSALSTTGILNVTPSTIKLPTSTIPIPEAKTFSPQRMIHNFSLAHEIIEEIITSLGFKGLLIFSGYVQPESANKAVADGYLFRDSTDTISISHGDVSHPVAWMIILNSKPVRDSISHIQDVYNVSLSGPQISRLYVDATRNERPLWSYALDRIFNFSSPSMEVSSMVPSPLESPYALMTMICENEKRWPEVSTMMRVTREDQIMYMSDALTLSPQEIIRRVHHNGGKFGQNNLYKSPAPSTNDKKLDDSKGNYSEFIPDVDGPVPPTSGIFKYSQTGLRPTAPLPSRRSR
jgi:hypothetical protein